MLTVAAIGSSNWQPVRRGPTRNCPTGMLLLTTTDRSQSRLSCGLATPVGVHIHARRLRLGARQLSLRGTATNQPSGSVYATPLERIYPHLIIRVPRSVAAEKANFLFCASLAND
jgi:hypothetical protein